MSVKGQTTMTLRHACPGGCGRQVRRSHYACRTCWYRLPPVLRYAIERAHAMNDHGAHRAAMRDAADWYAANPLT